MGTLSVPAGVLEELAEAARAAYPREACGLLVGSAVGPARREVVRGTRARNLAAAPDRFDLHPEDHLAAADAAARDGLLVLGVWHSHPDRSAVPSAADRRGAPAGWSQLVLAVDARGVWSARAWRDGPAGLVPEELEVAGPGGRRPAASTSARARR